MSSGSSSQFADLVQNYIQLLESQDKLSRESPLQPIVDVITNNDKKLIDLIQILGPLLKDEDGAQRAKALNCLAKTLDSLPEDKLSLLEINHLTKFFMTKFDDLLAFKQVLLGLNSLISMKKFSVAENLELVLKELRDNYNSKNFGAAVRYLTFQILENFIGGHDRTFDRLIIVTGNEIFNDLFVKTFLNIATGEKDPRNLMISFKLNETILKNFNNIKDFKEDLFDVSFCYFPIAFKPPKNDPYKITSMDLKTTLRNALTANEATIEDLLPNLFEKLTSNSPSVKQDVLDTLKDAVQNFSVEAINSHWIEIWDALKFEILHDVNLPYEPIMAKVQDIVDQKPEVNLDILPPDEKEKQETVAVSSSSLLLFAQLAQTLAENAEYLQQYLDKVSEELNQNINDPKSKFIKQSYLIFSIIAQSNDASFNHVIKDVGPKLFSSSNLQGYSTDEQLAIIDVIAFFLKSYLNLYGSHKNQKLKTKVVVDVENNEIFKFKDDIIIILSKLLLSSSSSFTNLKIKALENLSLVVYLCDFLSVSEVKMILTYITDILLAYVNFENNVNEDSGIAQNKFDLKPAQSDEKKAMFKKIYPFCLDILVTITELNSEYISLDFFPQFFSLLPDDVTGEFDLSNLEKILVILSDLSTKNGNLLETFSIRLISKFNVIFDTYRNKAHELSQKQDFLNYGILILNVLYQTLFKFLKNNPDFKTNNSFLKKYVPILLKVTLSLNENDVFYNDHFVELSSRILYLIILRSRIHNHQQLLDEFTALFVPRSNGMVSLEEMNITAAEAKKISYDILAKPNKTINLFVKLIAGIDYKSTEFLASSTNDSVVSFIESVVKLLDDEKVQDVYARLGYLQLLSIITNKWLQPSHEEFVSKQYQSFTSSIKQHIANGDLSETLRTLEIYAWVAKALVLKNDKLATQYVNFLLELIDDAAAFDSKSAVSNVQLGSKVCRSFEILVDEGLIFTSDCTKKDSKVSINNKLLLLKINKEKNNNVNVKALYKQKLFETIIPKLISSFKENTKIKDDEVSIEATFLRKTYYLTTLSSVANYMNTDIILAKVEEFFPLLVESIKLQSASVRVAALTTLESVILTKTAAFISSYLSSLVPILIDCSKSFNYYKKDFGGAQGEVATAAAAKKNSGHKINRKFIRHNSQEVRELSLSCLIRLCEVVDLIKLMPFKEEVLKNLVVPLDDKKREVRRRACICRQEFYDLGQVKA